jgi:MGT family glycosyltransferase
MARFLFVVPPLTGHVNPTISVGRELARRGHHIAWAGHPSVVRALLPAEAELIPLEEGELLARHQQLREQANGARGLLAFKQLWEEFFVPLSRSMSPGVEAAVDAFRPDVMLVDQQALAGAWVARRRKLRWATLATTSARLADSLADLPKVREWVEGLFAQLERETGLEPRPSPDLSPELVVLFSSELFAGKGRFPSQTRFVGPSILDRPERAAFPWERLLPGPRLLVSLGTLNAARGAQLYRVLAEALSAEPLQVVLVAPPEVASGMPNNFLVQSRVPQLALLSHVQAVLCHGGHNTVCEALSFGLPLVVMPIRDDQPVIAQQVQDAGVGLRLRFGRTSAADLRATIRRVLDEQSFRAAAVRIQESFRDAGGALAAADAIEALS